MLNVGNLRAKLSQSSLLANKYVLTSFLFVFWIVFISENNLITIFRLERMIDHLEEERDYYSTEMDNLEGQLFHIEVERENYAREEFYLHRSNEIVYLIR